LILPFAGYGNEYNSLLKTANQIDTQNGFMGATLGTVGGQDFLTIWQIIKNNLAGSSAAIIWGLILIIILALLIVWLILICQAALIHVVTKINQGKSINLWAALVEGATHAWPLFALRLITRFAVLIILMMAILPFILVTLVSPFGATGITGLIIVAFLIFVPLSLIISFVAKYASAYIVIYRETWFRSLIRALNLFGRNWLVSLEMAGLLFLINILVNIVFSFIPNTIQLRIISLLTDFNLLTLFKSLPIILLVLAVNIWLAVFTYTAWTLLFLKLQTGPVVPKLVRLTSEIPNYLSSLGKTKIKSPTKTKRNGK
ncbi:MAG: hypothetical protein AAB657_02130, partial [Patescibacteria group bacterium]